MRKLWVIWIPPFLLATACEKSGDGAGGASVTGSLSDSERSQALAKVDNVTITVGDFSDRINKQSPYIRARYTSLERKKEFLQNLIRFEVLAKEAAGRGFDKDPEVVRTMKQVMIQKLTKQVIEESIKLTDITDQEMKKFYDDHLSEYRKPEQVRAMVVLAKDKATAVKVRKEATAKGKDNRTFREMVTKYSIDEETKSRGGDLRYFGREDEKLPKPLLDAAFALEKIGDVSAPVKVDKGFYVAKLTGRRRELNRAFEEVKRQIQNRLYREKRTNVLEDFVAKLKSSAQVKIFDDKLAAVPVDTPTPGAAPGAPASSAGQDPSKPTGGGAPGHP